MDQESAKVGQPDSQEASRDKQPPPLQDSDINPRQNHTQSQGENDNLSRKQTRGVWITAIGTAVVAIATVVVALTNVCSTTNTSREMKVQSKAMQDMADATKVQAEASQTAAKVAKNTLDLTQAADLQPGDPPIRCTTPGGGPLSLDSTVAFLIRNTGRTRAEMTEIDIRLRIPGSQEPTMTEPVTTRATIGAGDQYSSSPAILVRKTINTRQLERINNGELEYHLKGHVKYFDIFDNSHTFQLDSVYVPNTLCTFQIRCTSSRNECEDNGEKPATQF
ncbi:MAG: hypothetical protein A3H27_07575 [Acidobacteria bacterium RIFCSPLOWO2_02_FULL_59_13]|nr:MAG: hypothetical protein A3H27_07575 [Acidobacteria bacterium RIFCSPLOWO2_02_FULL_59_13]